MKNFYLKKAQDNFPEIIETEIVPDVRESVLKHGTSIVIDLKNHYVGYFSFRMKWVDIYIDAPVRLSVRFCETKEELYDDFSAYKGSLCGSWLQEEIINIDFPGEYKMPRRYAARYIKMSVIASPQKLVLTDFKYRAVTSADVSRVKECQTADGELQRIDKLSINTLKNCMQRVFEDGPKRDRRLWIGDLRLEALTNYETFHNLELVRRCLYLFAAAETNELGFMASYIYENPEFAAGEGALIDYALLYVACVCDYYKHSGDIEVLQDLYPLIKQQMDAAHRLLDQDGIIAVHKTGGAFIDWCEGLCKTTALHGVYLYVLRLLIGILKETRHRDGEIYAKRLESAKEAASHILVHPQKKIFVNEKDHFQYSVHSVVWMILGGVIEGEEAGKALNDVLASEKSIKPFTPYMHHYVVEAMTELQMFDEAAAYIKNYWGGMVKLGADTFYEVYVPGDPDFSPYGDRMINSMCHAWSCTPSYFIRKYHL